MVGGTQSTGDSVEAGPGLGVTLAPAALQREVLWSWGGLAPPLPFWSWEGGGRQQEKDPTENGGLLQRGSAGGGRAAEPQLLSTGMCRFQRVGVLLARIEPHVDGEGMRVASIPESLSPAGGGGASGSLTPPHRRSRLWEWKNAA